MNNNELVNTGLCGVCSNPLTADDVLMGIMYQYGVETGDLKPQAGGLCARCAGKDVYGTLWTRPPASAKDKTGYPSSIDGINKSLDALANDHSIFFNDMLDREKHRNDPIKGSNKTCSFCQKVDMGGMQFLQIQALTTSLTYENIDVCGDCARKYGYL